MTQASFLENAYLELIKKALTASLYDESAWELAATRRPFITKFLSGQGLVLLKKQKFDHEARQSGLDWPLFAYTMIGHKRLDNLQACIDDVLASGVPGDFIETGVWRGGATIFMRAMLKARSVTDRIVWAADSFEGLPKPVDAADGADLSEMEYLAVSLERVRSNFERFGLLDDQVRFLQGWFSETLPSAPINRLSILRLDGDLYSSTMDALTALYPKVSHGGYVIVDDYASWPSCKRAVTDYLQENKVTAEIKMIDTSAAYWKVVKPAEK